MFFLAGLLVAGLAGLLILPAFARRALRLSQARARMLGQGLDVSELRKGRKPGTSVFTIRDAVGGPNLVISATGAGDN